MAKDPAILFYTSDYLTGTRFFTWEQKGKYMELLCLQQSQGHLHKDDIEDMCGWDEKIMRKFVQDDNGLYYNERMENEIVKRKAYTKSRRNNLKGGNNKSHMEGDMNKHMKPHMENENININKDINKGGSGGKKINADINGYVDIYNSICINLPKVLKTTDKRKTAIRKFAKEFSVEEFKTICINLNRSEYYTGDNDTGWKANFDYIMRTDKANKFLEGSQTKRKSFERQTENYDHLAVDLFADEKPTID